MPRSFARVLLLVLGLAVACDAPGDRAGGSARPVVVADTLGVTLDAPSEHLFVETGDLPALEETGTLRILVHAELHADRLSRTGISDDLDVRMVETFAREHGLEPVVVRVRRFDRLLDALENGLGDVVAHGLTVLDERRARVGFTVPLRFVREQVVVRKDDAAAISTPEDLDGRTLAVRPSSSYVEAARGLVRGHPGIEIEDVSEELDTHSVVAGVGDGRFDVTIADSDIVSEVLAYRDDVAVAFDVTGDRAVAWAVRSNATVLRTELDGFITQVQLSRPHESSFDGDLPEIRERKVLRVLTRNSAATYFLWRGQLMGFEYDLARRFAEANGLVVQIVVPPRNEDLLPWLIEGRGDVVAAGLTLTASRHADDRLAWSRPYSEAVETVVARADDPDVPATVEQLAGRTVVVRRNSSYWETLERLRDDGIDVALDAAPPEYDTEEIIARVAAGEYDLTVADDTILAIERTWRDDVRAATALGETRPHAWAVRADADELLAAVDEFFDRTVRGTEYNVLRARYFERPKRIRRTATERVEVAGAISPFDDLVKPHASDHGFDWRLVVAQMYQESRFDPGARSPAGAVGLMQLMPRTARHLGIEDPTDPESGIRAGVEYLAWTRERFEGDIAVADRLWFSLAAYNAGPGHVHDARRIARSEGLDPNRWFGHTERAMLLLSRPEYAQRARYGYCRGREPVNYVRKIRDRFQAYVVATD